MTDITKLTGLERTKAEQRMRAARLKIRPCEEFVNVKKKQRQISLKKRKQDKAFRKKQDEESIQETLG